MLTMDRFRYLYSTPGHLKIADFGLAFDGHWAHSQSYYATQRYSLLERFGITINGDDGDMRAGDGRFLEVFPLHQSVNIHCSLC